MTSTNRQRSWIASDWSFALASLHVAATAYEGGGVSWWAKLLARERAMGATWDARQSLRLRYIAPGGDTAADDGSVTQLSDYRNL